MDFLNGNIKSMYLKYLGAAFGSSLISSIYGVVDMAVVGQYHGPEGTAAMAVVSPVWNIIYSLGLLMGIGGSVLFSTLRGESASNERRSNELFSAAVLGTALLAGLTWLAVIFFDKQLLLLFGAEETLLPLARQYVLPIKFIVPSFLFTQLLSAFLRNDGNPGLATRAVPSGGFFNIFAGMLVVQSVFLWCTPLGRVPLAWWLPCMAAAVLLMYLLLFLGSNLSGLQLGYYCAQAFLLAELAASVEWQLHCWLMPGVPPYALRAVLLMAAVYGGIYGGMALIMRRRRESCAAEKQWKSAAVGNRHQSGGHWRFCRNAPLSG